MRILHVVPTYIPAFRYGGPIQSVHGLCLALARRGHRVDVATTSVDGEEDSDVPLEERVCLDGVGVHYFRSVTARRIYFSPGLYRYLEETMQEWDIVHTHSTFLFPPAAAAYLARRRRIPYVLSPRGMLVRDLIDRKSRWVKRAWIRLIERRNVSGAAAIHVTSEVEARELRSLGLEPRRVFEVPNGVEPSPARDIALAPAAIAALPACYVLYLGRISWKKRIESVLAAMPLLGDVHLVIAGNDDEGHGESLRALAIELRISHRTHFIGFVQGQAKWDLLARAAVLALASTSENFGNVVLEAMACGVPVVVTPEVGLAPLVRQTGSGIVSLGDPDSLAQAMRAILEQPDARRRMGENGRQASRAFTWDAVAQEMEAQYEAICPAEGA